MSVVLRDDQLVAINKLHNGCILCGDTGSGKSLTALGYYYKINGGAFVRGSMSRSMYNPMDLVIITTAATRDKHGWDHELLALYMSQNPEANFYHNRVIVDSWNNIGKYVGATNCFFIFDEQRVVGSGAWVKAFYKITAKNKWILLSATPGDKWEDYIPVFVANGFYRDKSQFIHEHVVYKPHIKFPVVERYLGEMKLLRLRESILVDIDYNPNTIQHHETIIVKYDKDLYRWVGRERKNPYETLVIEGVHSGRKTIVQKPINNASEYCNVMRRVVNSDPSRQEALLDILKDKERVIVFYNFDFELDILRKLNYGKPVYEWNGHNHNKLPEKGPWVYLVQYLAGNEGWNCTSTNYMVFFSENYSYRIMHQAAGRIDRVNTKYKDLYYWHLRTTSNIDLAINKALSEKKKFNQAAFYKRATNTERRG